MYEGVWPYFYDVRTSTCTTLANNYIDEWTFLLGFMLQIMYNEPMKIVFISNLLLKFQINLVMALFQLSVFNKWMKGFKNEVSLPQAMLWNNSEKWFFWKLRYLKAFKFLFLNYEKKDGLCLLAKKGLRQVANEQQTFTKEPKDLCQENNKIPLRHWHLRHFLFRSNF